MKKVKEPPKEIVCITCCAKAKLIGRSKTKYTYRCHGCNSLWYKYKKKSGNPMRKRGEIE